MALSLPHDSPLVARPRAGTGLDEPARQYDRLAHVYDLIFGAPLQAGRVAAIQRLGIRPGHRVLEVGVGTGLNLPLYPRHCRVTAIDLSPSMLDRARRRAAACGLSHVQLLEVDATQMPFDDEAFDRVYAPYVISTVPEPLAVAREMARVCRPGGRIVLLNHFRSTNRLLAWLERALSPLVQPIGFRTDLDLAGLLRRSRLEPTSIERVNFPPIWSLVTCRRRA